MRVVLDGATFMDALTDDTGGVLSALIRACDQIVVNGPILREYSKNRYISALLSAQRLRQLEETLPKPKVIRPAMRPVPWTSGPKHHRVLFQGAIRAEADIVIIGVQQRGKWDRVARQLSEKHRLRLLAPEQYVAER